MAAGHDKNACGGNGAIWGQGHCDRAGSPKMRLLQQRLMLPPAVQTWVFRINAAAARTAQSSCCNRAGLAPLPAVYASADRELVNLFGPIPEPDYSILLLAHKDVRSLPRVSAVFEFCVRELKPVLTRGEMKRSQQGDH
jgi:hypothetical protein